MSTSSTRTKRPTNQPRHNWFELKVYTSQQIARNYHIITPSKCERDSRAIYVGLMASVKEEITLAFDRITDSDAI